LTVIWNPSSHESGVENARGRKPRQPGDWPVFAV
jgi:hypothetical protein